MEPRAELRPRPVGEAELMSLGRRIEAIAELLGRGSTAEAEIEEFNELTGHSYEADDFRHYQASRSLEDFALEAARPEPRRVPDITREALVEIVTRIMNADPETEHYVRLFQANVLHPGASALIYWPPEELADASPEEYVPVEMCEFEVETGRTVFWDPAGVETVRSESGEGDVTQARWRGLPFHPCRVTSPFLVQAVWRAPSSVRTNLTSIRTGRTKA